MVEPIDPVSAKVNAGLVAELPKVEAIAMTPDRRAADKSQAVTAAHARAVRENANAPPETTPHPGFEVHIDGPTLRVYSEMRDPDTQRVMQRIPTGYQPKFEPPRDYTPTEFET